MSSLISVQLSGDLPRGGKVNAKQQRVIHDAYGAEEVRVALELCHEPDVTGMMTLV